MHHLFNYCLLHTLCPSLWHASQWLCVFSVCPQLSDVCSCSTWSRNSLLKDGRVKEGEGREEDGQTVEMALHQINVITALIRQPFILKGARTVRGRQEGRKKRASVAFRCLCVCLPPAFLSSPPPSFHELWWAPQLLCVQGYLKATPLEEIPGDRGARSYHTQPKHLHLNPEGQTRRWIDSSFTLVLLCTSSVNRNSGTALSFWDTQSQNNNRQRK